ncbi:hypothetical protein HB662_02575 [Roseomonas frigidaquae]|uniref:Uncharacterized protein n=1 Tax=Falsiroseomonas frigidaquae TaxID=487318 RepID=A0ABX1ESP4_9PROT|nr:hypothetical protein [Falsiroseomonas frigidaquae]NKE43645.1 hypothetical protein [Falsiroseomonas frigidaquae]
MKPAPSRRGILAAAPAALLLPAAPASVALPVPPAPAPMALPEADGRLFALRTTAFIAMDAHEAAHAAWTEAEEARDRTRQPEARAAEDAAWGEYEAALLDMADIPAAGLVGLAAKMSATLAYADPEGGQNYVEFELLASAAEDAARLLDDLALPDPPERPAASPDAELLILWDRWCEVGERMQAAEARLRELAEGAGGLPFFAPPVQALVVQQAALAEERRQVLATIAERPAVTRSGREAKAEILGSYVTGRDDAVSCLAASLVRDVLG